MTYFIHTFTLLVAQALCHCPIHCRTVTGLGGCVREGEHCVCAVVKTFMLGFVCLPMWCMCLYQYIPMANSTPVHYAPTSYGEVALVRSGGYIVIKE